MPEQGFWDKLQQTIGQGVNSVMDLTSTDANAAMPPAIRSMFQAARKAAVDKGLPELYHGSYNPEDFLKNVTNLEDARKWHEDYKPFAIYAADSPKNIPGHLTAGWSQAYGTYKGTSRSNLDPRGLTRLKAQQEVPFQNQGATNIIRITPNPESKMFSMTEGELRKAYQDYLQSPEGLTHTTELATKEGWTRKLREQGDILKLTGADHQDNLNEYMLLHPDFNRYFWENKALLPGVGLHEVPSNLKKEASRFSPQAYKNAVASDAMGEYFGPMEGIGDVNPHVSAHPRYKDYGYDTLQQLSDVAGDLGMDNSADRYSSAAFQLIQKHPELAAIKAEYEKAGANFMPGTWKGEGQMPAPAKGFEPSVNQKVKAYFGIGDDKWNAMSKLDKSTTIAKMLDDPNYWKIGLGSAVLGAGALSSQPDNAEAMPLGKLTKQTAKSALEMAVNPRSEDSFYNLLGKTLNLKGASGEHSPMSVIDVRRNPKSDWHYLVVEDANGVKHQLPMTKDYLNVLNAAVGTNNYLDQFNTSGYQGKKLQALKSLTKREAQRESGSIEPNKVRDFKAFNTMQAAKVNEIDPSLVHDYVYVRTSPKDPVLYMPRPYAELLQSKGHLQIIGNGPNFSKGK